MHGGFELNDRRGFQTMLVPVAAATIVFVLAQVGAGSVAARASAARAAPLSACSRHIPHVGVNPWAAARAKLAPREPERVVLCRYSGLNAHPRLSLVATATISAPGRIRRLVSAFDALPQFPRVVVCPADDGSEIVAHLSYRSHHSVTLGVEETGCTSVTNGDLRRAAFTRPGQQLLAELKRLTPE